MRIGLLEYAFAVLGPRFIDEFAQEQLGLLVEPIDAPPEQLAFALKSGALDLQFAAFAEQSRLPVRSGLRELTVITEPMALLVDENHRFAKRKRVTLAEAGKERLVLFERARSPEVYRATVQAFDELAIRPRIKLEVGLLQTMSSAVRAIGGAGLVPACVRTIQDAGLRVVPIDKDQSPRIRLSLIWSAKRDSEPVLALVDWVRRRKARESGVIDRQRSRRTNRSSLSVT